MELEGGGVEKTHLLARMVEEKLVCDKAERLGVPLDCSNVDSCSLVHRSRNLCSYPIHWHCIEMENDSNTFGEGSKAATFAKPSASLCLVHSFLCPGKRLPLRD